MKQYRAVVFDWDGTVMDSTHGIVSAMQAACADLGLPVPDRERASWVIGLSLEAALYHVVPTLTAEQLPAFLQRYRAHFLERDARMELFPGIRDLLDGLRARGVRLAVATGKSRVGLDRVLGAARLASLFECTRCADECESKPDPAMLLEILQEFGLPGEEVVMVGDTAHDIQMASGAGVDSVAVAYGAHDRQTLLKARPTVLVADVAGMRDWLLERV